MANHVLLNNVEHRNLRVVTARGAAYGDDVMSALTFPAEFRSIQAHYPIVFRKAPNGQFQPLALFGFRERQNLFLREASWDAAYLPLMIERQPFLIGFAGNGDPVVHIDLGSPRVGKSAGEALFREHGGTTEYLERMTALLHSIQLALQGTVSFVAAVVEHDLLESFVLDVQLDDGSQNRLAGFYTINEERLSGLGGSALERLSKAGHLQAAYMAIASLSNFRTLIELRNRLHAGDP
ncbi:MAG TPA: SapC family protein [Steroidobacteraceae bacterium]|nr:SapC family protein [Steroidobacteraceae bacterium]